ncbi:MAG: hypothetical protein K0R47_1712 [Brevibacillus sp.]|nr:hypothetical protein [Brevibacillus sp.]
MLFERRLIVAADRYDQPVARAKSNPKGPGVIVVIVIVIAVAVTVAMLCTDVFLFHENPPFIYLLQHMQKGKLCLD